jgi:hypothetical protein
MILEQTCHLCNQPSEIELDDELWACWRDGLANHKPAATHGVQVIFAHLSADDRELIISGTHPECWDKMFGQADD